MSKINARPASPNGESSSHPNKRQKTSSAPPKFSSAPAINLPEAAPLAEQYQGNKPYKHISVGGLFDDSVLEGVVTESRTYGERHTKSALRGWGWEHKETDIYKIQQTPDLTSLSPEHLPEETLEKLPYLCKLKESIYSKEFRDFIRQVTGCGPLSGKKVDGSVGLYSQGSHLLLHDDSISTRVVSYILYLPNSPPTAPTSSTSTLAPSADNSFLKGWQSSWGGALELYPIEGGEDKEVGPPAVKRSEKVDVKWGNLVFFEVQPGKSYHSVEEVVVGDGRQRLGISGWFHRPIEGEDGYEKQDELVLKQKHSSLAQITSAPVKPLIPYDPSSEPPTGLTSSHLKHLQKYLSPSYLSSSTLERLANQFVEGSEVVMHNFLKPEIAAAIKEECKKVDEEDYGKFGKGEDGGKIVPAHETGEREGWTLEGPSSKHRFLALADKPAGAELTPTFRSVAEDLYPSEAFRAWLSVVSSLVVLARRVEGRRFRRGLDYTLANGEDKDGEPRLDGVLGLSWWAPEGSEEEQEENEVDVGGWECYLAPPEEDEDPAVFRSSNSATQNGQDGEAEADDTVEHEGTAGRSDGENKPKITMGGVELEFDESQLSPSDFDSDSEGGDDGPLLHLGLGFNKFLLVLRDPGVMRFVKYLSNGADGSRWDICGEFEVGQLAEEDDEEEDAK